MKKRGLARLGVAWTLAVLTIGAVSAQSSAPQTPDDISQLKAQVQQLQEQLQAVSKRLDEAIAKTSDAATDSAASSAAASTDQPPSKPLIASTEPMIVPPAPVTRPSKPFGSPLAGPTPYQSPAPESPLQIKIGDAYITPIGFMDLTATWKSTNAGGSLGTTFGSIPYNNTVQAHNSEFRFSPQNSRIGFRIDAMVHDAHVMAYNEDDFLGTSGANNLSITNGAFVPRLRLFWVDVTKGHWEILGGQSWSMMTANRKGISPLPGDIFYSQVMDVNYMNGMVWTRQPGFRLIYHPSDKIAWGLALENPNAYMGGANGGAAVTLPTALTSLAGSQIDNGTSVQTTPNLTPDFISKVAFDPTARVHFEIAGIIRTFRIWNPNTNTHFTTEGAGGSVNGNFEIVKNLRLVTNNYWSDGGGRYLFGAAPDLILRSDGSISPVHSGGTVQGFEATVKNTLIYAYYGGLFIDKNVALDANGTSLIGYGYRGSANSMNRYVQELTFGFNQTFWKDPKYGALNLITQYGYFFREPWYLALNNPKQAHLSTVWVDLRYTLPGSAPAMK